MALSSLLKDMRGQDARTSTPFTGYSQRNGASVRTMKFAVLGILGYNSST